MVLWDEKSEGPAPRVGGGTEGTRMPCVPLLT